MTVPESTVPTFSYDPDEAEDSFGPSIVFTHDCPSAFGQRPAQHLPVDVPSKWDEIRGAEPVWHLAQIEPLTVTPSILCAMCGTHGFITDGKWVSV